MLGGNGFGEIVMLIGKFVFSMCSCFSDLICFSWFGGIVVNCCRKLVWQLQMLMWCSQWWLFGSVLWLCVKLLWCQVIGVWLKYIVLLCMLCISFMMFGLNRVCVFLMVVVRVDIGVVLVISVFVIVWMLVVGVNGLLFCRLIIIVLLVQLVMCVYLVR